MTTLETRKIAELNAKLSTLEYDFEHWRNLITHKDESRRMNLHKSQINRLIGNEKGKAGLLEQLRRDIIVELNKLSTASARKVLKDARPIEEMILAIHCMWGFFRDKLAQRLDTAARPFLAAADELAWACYSSARDASKKPMEAPLVFLNGQFSPFMQSRGTQWTPEDVPGTIVTDPEFSKVLRRLPLPVIGVPFVQLRYLPELVFVAHETGHAVEDDFQLGTVLDKAIRALKLDKSRERDWLNWKGEIFADMWATANTGPAFVAALQDFLAPDHLSAGDATYPPTGLRIRIGHEALRLMGLHSEATRLHAAWVDASLDDVRIDHDDDLNRVVSTLMNTNLFEADGTSVAGLGRYDAKRHDAVIKSADSAMMGRGILTTDARLTIGVLHRCFEADPAAFNNKKVKPAPERTMTEHALVKLRPAENIMRSASHDLSGDVATDGALFESLMNIYRKANPE